MLQFVQASLFPPPVIISQRQVAQVDLGDTFILVRVESQLLDLEC